MLYRSAAHNYYIHCGELDLYILHLSSLLVLVISERGAHSHRAHRGQRCDRETLQAHSPWGRVVKANMLQRNQLGFLCVEKI